MLSDGSYLQAMRMAQGSQPLAVELLVTGAVESNSRTGIVQQAKGDGPTEGAEERTEQSRLGWVESEIRSMLCLVSSDVAPDASIRAMQCWSSGRALQCAAPDPVSSEPQTSEAGAMEEVLMGLASQDASTLLESVGTILGDLFGGGAGAPGGGEPEAEAADEPEPEAEAGAAAGGRQAASKFRRVPLPAADAANRADFLITASDFQTLAAGAGSPRDDQTRLPVNVRLGMESALATPRASRRAHPP